MLPSWLPRQPWGQSCASPPAVPSRWRHCGASKAPVTRRQMQMTLTGRHTGTDPRQPWPGWVGLRGKWGHLLCLLSLFIKSRHLCAKPPSPQRGASANSASEGLLKRGLKPGCRHAAAVWGQLWAGGNEGWVRPGRESGCGGERQAGLARSILSNRDLAYSGLPLQAQMVCKGPVHPQPEQRREASSFRNSSPGSSFWKPREPCSDLHFVLFQKIPPLRE